GSPITSAWNAAIASIVGWSIGPSVSGGLPDFARKAARSCRTMATSAGRLAPRLPTDLENPVVIAPHPLPPPEKLPDEPSAILPVQSVRPWLHDYMVATPTQPRRTCPGRVLRGDPELSNFEVRKLVTVRMTICRRPFLRLRRTVFRDFFLRLAGR